MMQREVYIFFTEYGNVVHQIKGFDWYFSKYVLVLTLVANGRSSSVRKGSIISRTQSENLPNLNIGKEV